jgi:hypothetical protein
VKSYILKKCEANRPGWGCERISAKVLNEINIYLKLQIEDSVKRHPTKGKTFLYFK